MQICHKPYKYFVLFLKKEQHIKIHMHFWEIMFSSALQAQDRLNKELNFGTELEELQKIIE